MNYLSIPKRSFLLFLTGISLSTQFMTGAKAVTSKPQTLRDFGAVGDGVTDDTAAIKRAIAAKGLVVFAPEGKYLYSEDIDFGEKGLTGVGTLTSFISVNAEKMAFFFRGGKGVVVEGFKLSCDSVTVRNRNKCGYRGAGLVFIGSHDFIIRDVAIDSTTNAGIVVDSCTRGEIYDCVVMNSRADGIYTTKRSSFIVVRDNKVIGAGDDGISFVSYRDDGSPSHNLKAIGNLVYGGLARGITNIGSDMVEISGNTIESKPVGGIYVAYDNSYSTFVPKNTVIKNNKIRRIVSSISWQGRGIFVLGADNEAAENIQVFDNIIEETSKEAVLVKNARGVILERNSSKPGLVEGPEFIRLQNCKSCKLQ